MLGNVLNSLKILWCLIKWFNHVSLFLNILLESVISVAFSLDSQYLVTGSNDTTIILVDMQNLNIIHTF